MRNVADMGSNIPAFLGKLWKIVEDPETDDLISWSNEGNSFVISNPVRFTQELLPMYFKHNNMASFIRQLNMYGFHKMTSIESGGLRKENECLEFSHTCFCKGHPYLLQNIKRKTTKTIPTLALVRDFEKDTNELGQNELLAKILAEVNSLKGKQANWDAKLAAMKRENEALWRELAIFRQKHMKQEQIINRLISFIVRMVTTQNIPLRRRIPLMLNDVERVQKSSSSPNGPTICELDELLGEPSNWKRAKTSRKSTDEYVVPDMGDQDQEQEPAYQSQYVVMSPEEGGDVQHTMASPWISDGSDFESEAMTPVNPILTLPITHLVDNNEKSQTAPKQIEKGNKNQKSVKARKNVGKKKMAQKMGVKAIKEKKSATGDILQETLNRIQLEPHDLASPDASSSITIQDPVLSDGEPDPNFLKILQDVANQVTTATTTTEEPSTSKANEEILDPLSLALAKPNTSYVSEDVARELGSHVDNMQNDLDVLKEFLKGDNYNFDANALLELFTDDPLSLIMPTTDNEKDNAKPEANNELMMYNSSPNILDLSEVYGTAAPTTEQQPSSSSPIPPLSPSILETPVMTPATPGFPPPAKKRRT